MSDGTREEKAIAWARRLAVAVAVFALANLVLGWGLGLEFFQRGGQGLPSMVPETALSFLGLGGAQVLVTLRRPRAAVAAVLALLVGASALMHPFIVSLGWVRDSPNDRMSQATIIIVVLIGLSILLGTLSRRLPALAHLAPCLFALMLAVGGGAAFLFDVQEVERYYLLQGLSVPTCLAGSVLPLAVILSRPDLQAISVLFAKTPGGRLSRWFLPYTLVLPLALTLAGDVGADLGWFGPKARLAVVAVTLMVLSVSFVMSVAVLQDRVHDQQLRYLSMMEAVLSGLDAGVVVLKESDTPHMPVMQNRAFRNLIRGRTLQGWLNDDGFRSLEDDSPLRGADHPVQKTLTDGQTRMVAWSDEVDNTRVLQFAAFRNEGTLPGGALTVLVVSDVTLAWRQRASMALTERLNAIGHLAGGVAHEVTNIFGIIKLAVGTAELIAPQGAPYQYAAILNACRRGGDLAGRLQRLSVETSGYERTIDAVAAIKAAADLAARGLPPAIRLETCLPGAVVPVTCDPTELEMAVLNLVLNARNAMVDSGETDGRIDLRLAVRDGALELSVSDTGPGIPPDLVDRVREPFFTTRGISGGTGLGLALIDAFVQRADGHVTLTSTVGEGTEVQIVLPVAEDLSEFSEDGRPAAVDLSGLRILLAEDDDMLKQTLHDALLALNATVERAESAEAALNLLSRGDRFDILLTAVNFRATLTGPELAERALALHPGLGVVFLTADRDTAAERGDLPGPVFHKPVHLGVLSRAIVDAASSGQGRS